MYPLLLEDSTGTAVTFITDTGLLSCQGISSSRVAVVDSLQLISTNATIDSSGNIIGTSLVANGSNGISVYNGSAKTAAITQAGVLTRTNLSTTGIGISVGTGTGG